MKRYRFLWAAFVLWIVSGSPSDVRAYREVASNLALNKPSSQSSTSEWSTTNDAQGAVDGVKNGRWGFHTRGERNPWWQVDLQSLSTLTEIRVFNRLDCCAERARSLQILLSNDGSNWRTAYRHDGTTFGGNDGKPLVVRLNAERARYVRLQLDASEYFHLDEVEVYGFAGAAGGATPAVGSSVSTGGQAREVHWAATPGAWSTDAASGATTGSIPNDCGGSFWLLPRTVDRSSFTVTARVRFRSHVDYGGVGIAVLDPNSTNERMPHLRLELSERQDHFGAGGWLARNGDYYATPEWRNAGRDIRVNEWYRLKLEVHGTRVRGWLDDVELYNADLPAVGSLPSNLQLAFFIIEADAEFELLGAAPPAPTGSGASGEWEVEDATGKMLGTVSLSRNGSKVSGTGYIRQGTVKIHGDIIGDEIHLLYVYDFLAVSNFVPAGNFVAVEKVAKELVGITSKVILKIGNDPDRLDGTFYGWSIHLDDDDNLTERYEGGTPEANADFPPRKYSLVRKRSGTESTKDLTAGAAASFVDARPPMSVSAAGQGGFFRLKSTHGTWLVFGSSGLIEHQRDVTEGRDVTLIDHNGGSLQSGDVVSLRTYSGRYVTTDGAKCDASASSVGERERWTIHKDGGGTISIGDRVGFRSSFDKYLVAEGSGSEVNADRGAMAAWENFTLETGRGTAASAPAETLEPAADEPGVQFTIEAYGRDESDGSDVGWNSRYPNPSFDDEPDRRGKPNARWIGSSFLVGNYLALGIEALETPYPPDHTVAVGYTVSLTGATFEDGLTMKTVVLHRFSGTPADNEFLEFVRIIPRRQNR